LPGFCPALASGHIPIIPFLRRNPVQVQQSVGRIRENRRPSSRKLGFFFLFLEKVAMFT
jgi:hypothetical protein